MEETAAAAAAETQTASRLHATLPALPFELVVEVLCHLPVKLLLQLRCLCKSLDTLISDPKFIKKHLRMSTTRQRLLLISYYQSHVMSYPLHSNFSTVTNNATRHHYPFAFKPHLSFGSCDGMVCLEIHGSVILWNPSIQKFKTLPSSGSYPGFGIHGFGFDTLIGNYKVVSVLCTEIDVNLEDAKIKVHTLGTNSWRMIPGEFPVPLSRSLKLASGALHWLASSDYTIVSFDLVNESYRKFLLPKYGLESVFRVFLDVLRDCLCIFAHGDTFSSIWMMKEYGNEESWTQLFRVPRSEDSFYDLYTTPLWISEDDQVLMMKECKPSSSWRMNLALCDFKNGAFRIQIMQKINSWVTPEVYIESLVSPCF